MSCPCFDPDQGRLVASLGLLQAGLGFMVVVWSAGLADASFRVPLMVLGLLYLLHTTGELFLSPVGLSEITKLSLSSVVSGIPWHMHSFRDVHTLLGNPP